MKPSHAILFLFTLSFSPRAWSEWFADGNLNLTFDDSVNHALKTQDRNADFIFATSLTGGQYFQLTSNTTASLFGNFKSNVYSEYGDLTNYSLGGGTSIKQKFGLGPYAPWMRFSAMANHGEYENKLRSGWVYKGIFTLGKRINEQWDLNISYNYQRRIPDRFAEPFEYEEDYDHTGDHHDDYDKYYLSPRVFDLETHTIAFNGIYFVNHNIAVTAGYSLQIGDAYSTNELTEEIAEYASAAAQDDAFGHNQVAYKLSAQTHSFSLAGSYAFNANSSVNLGYTHHWIDGEYGMSYHVNVVELCLMYRF